MSTLPVSSVIIACMSTLIWVCGISIRRMDHVKLADRAPDVAEDADFGGDVVHGKPDSIEIRTVFFEQFPAAVERFDLLDRHLNVAQKGLKPIGPHE